MAQLIFAIIVSYLLGSIPFGYLLVRVFRGEDVRQSGSGNIGASNVSRKSPLLGVITLLLDAAKGAAAVALAAHFVRLNAAAPDSARVHYFFTGLAALFAILGHMFPVWLRFRGGKGVATGLGAFLMIAPKAALISAGIFAVVAFATRYSSAGSITAVLAFPFLAWGLDEYGNTPAALAFMSLSSFLIIVRHRDNIRRLMAGNENRFGSKRENSGGGSPSGSQKR